MRVCGLLSIVYMVVADTVVSSHGIDQSCPEDMFPNESEVFICENPDEKMIQNCSLLDCENSANPESICNLHMTCNTYKSNQLNCSWSTQMLSKGAQYSAFVHLCGDGEDNGYHPLHCSSNSGREIVECHGQILKSENVMVKVHVSMFNYSLMHCSTFVNANIEILEPPQNITAVIESQQLEIKWSPPKMNTRHICFDYELNINDEPVHISVQSTHTKPNIVLTRTYSIKIRAKWNDCASNDHWGEWSETVVVDPTEKPYQLNWYVIVSIAFVLPMILLAFLLACKFQRLSEKLFPSIPSPSVKVKMLLEKDDFGQVMPPKQDGLEAEEGAEVLQVTS